MPIFDYQCSKCLTVEEKLVKSSEVTVLCSKCNYQMTQLIGTPCFILKGAGFHSNGTFINAKKGPKIDQELLRLSDKELDKELGLPPDMCS